MKRSLREARIARYWTLRRAVEEVSACSDQPTGLTESLFSQWELGRVRPGLRYRAAISAAFAPDEIDFDAVDSAGSHGPRLVITYHDLIAAMERVTRERGRQPRRPRRRPPRAQSGMEQGREHDRVLAWKMDHRVEGS